MLSVNPNGLWLQVDLMLRVVCFQMLGKGGVLSRVDSMKGDDETIGAQPVACFVNLH